MADKRITPARADLAAEHLQGVVDAPRYVKGAPAMVYVGRTSLRARGSDEAEQVSELLFGEAFTVYDRKAGWAWGQAANDGYVGHVDEKALTLPFKPAHRIGATVAPVFMGPNLKRAVFDLLPMNSSVAVLRREGDYVNIEDDLYIHSRHLAAAPEADFVAVAQRFLGVPYVWGGKTYAGLDCSGLIQTALAAAGVQAPRDTDMMERDLGAAIGDTEAVRRGDLVFWKGHMGVMLDGERLLHANAFHMETVIEPLAAAVERIVASAGPVTSIRRL